MASGGEAQAAGAHANEPGYVYTGSGWVQEPRPEQVPGMRWIFVPQMGWQLVDGADKLSDPNKEPDIALPLGVRWYWHPYYLEWIRVHADSLKPWQFNDPSDVPEARIDVTVDMNNDGVPDVYQKRHKRKSHRRR